MAQRKGRNGNGKGSKRKTNDLQSALNHSGLHFVIAVVIIAYGWEALGGSSGLRAIFSRQYINSLSPLDRFTYYWPLGDAVEIRYMSNDPDDRGLVAARTIRKGEVTLVADVPDLGGEMARLEPSLPALLKEANQAALQEEKSISTRPDTSNLLSTLRFLQLIDIEKDPKWVAYEEALPKNVSSMAWYWTPEERQCVVPRPGDQRAPHKLAAFHATMQKVAQQSDLVRQLYQTNPLRAEWVYLMFKTRGFGDLSFLPAASMLNHNPLQAVPPFVVPQRQKVYFVAPHDIPEGTPVYNNYGELSTVHTAEVYGFATSYNESAYFESPSIQRDLIRSPNTHDIDRCTVEPPLFFGNVGDQVVEAQYAGSRNYFHFKSFVPTQSTMLCLQLLVNSQDEVKVARYVAEKLQDDYQQYATRANSPACQSDEGNFPIIQKTNEVTAQLMFDAYRYAEKVVAAEGRIAYPGTKQES